MKFKKILIKCTGILSIFCLLFLFGSCKTSDPTIKGRQHAPAYSKKRSKLPNWNTTTSLETRYVIKGKKRTKMNY